jgi:hypothetical protein
MQIYPNRSIYYACLDFGAKRHTVDLRRYASNYQSCITAQGPLALCAEIQGLSSTWGDRPFSTHCVTVNYRFQFRGRFYENSKFNFSYISIVTNDRLYDADTTAVE